MQCPDPECNATVNADARVCPQCGMDLGPSAPPGPGDGIGLGTESEAETARGRRVRKLANASLILAILSCPLSWLPISYALILLFRQWGLPSDASPSQEGMHRTFFAYLGTGGIVLVMALSAIAAGHMAIARGRRSRRTGGVPRRARFGTALGYLSIVLPIMLIAFGYFNKSRPSGDNAFCQHNLRLMGGGAPDVCGRQ